MFNQRKYINSYIKDNYHSIKLRIRNDDIIINNIINNVDNINKYILELIRKDVLENRTYNYISNEIEIDFELSITMTDLI